MTLSDQKLLARLRQYAKDKKMFVVHNLSNFYHKKQVEFYIENTLKKCFILKEQNLLKLAGISLEKMGNKSYFVERIDDINITHLIAAYDNSEAGEYYNESCYHYLKTQIFTFNAPVQFDLISELKNHLFESSKEFTEEGYGINSLNEIVLEDNRLVLKTNGRDDGCLKLKRCLTNELGVISQFYGSIIVPKFSFYRDNTNGEFIFLIDIPDMDSCNNPKIYFDNQYRCLTINGIKSMKTKDQIEKTGCQFTHDSREKGKFLLDFKVPYQEFDISNNKPKSTKYNNGVLKLVYEMKKEEVDEEETLKFD